MNNVTALAPLNRRMNDKACDHGAYDHDAHDHSGDDNGVYDDEDNIFVPRLSARAVPEETAELFTATPAVTTPVQALCSPTVLKLSSCPGLLRLRMGLTKHFTRVYPTRRVPLTPPAMAGVVSVADIEMATAMAGHPNAKALVVFLPSDFEPLVPNLVGQCPRPRVHADTGHESQATYMSWESTGGTPPNTLWVQPARVLEALDLNDATTGQLALPVIFVAGQTVATASFVPTQQWLAQVRAALAQELVAPVALGVDAMAKAADKAERYGQRPWLLMRYELTNAGQRLAVSWAPVCRPYRKD